MNSSKEKSSGTEASGRTNDALPPVGEPVWVKCGGYRTKAFRDQKGNWRNLVSREVLTGVVQVIKSD